MPEPYNTHVCPIADQPGMTPELTLRAHVAAIVLPDALSIFLNPCNDVYKALVEVTEGMRQFHNFEPYVATETAAELARDMKTFAEEIPKARAKAQFDTLDFGKLPKN